MRKIKHILVPSQHDMRIYSYLRSLGWNGVITDVTENERIKAELAQNNQKLQSALQIKESFLHNVSHEVRTPLNGISGN